MCVSLSCVHARGTHSRMHARASAWMHTHVCSLAHTHLHAHTRACTHTCMHVCMNMHALSLSLAHTRTLSLSLACSLSLCPSLSLFLSLPLSSSLARSLSLILARARALLFTVRAFLVDENVEAEDAIKISWDLCFEPVGYMCVFRQHNIRLGERQVSSSTGNVSIPAPRAPGAFSVTLQGTNSRDTLLQVI